MRLWGAAAGWRILSNILSGMLQTRRVTLADTPLITLHRKAMFAAIRNTPEATLDAMNAKFEPWLKRMLREGKYSGWITCDGDRPVASAGLMVLDWAPHVLDPEGEHRGYVLNLFVEPEYRGRGLARALTQECMTESRSKGIRVIALHASAAGRPLYEKLGFCAANEMLFVAPEGE